MTNQMIPYSLDLPSTSRSVLSSCQPWWGMNRFISALALVNSDSLQALFTVSGRYIWVSSLFHISQQLMQTKLGVFLSRSIANNQTASCKTFWQGCNVYFPCSWSLGLSHSRSRTHRRRARGKAGLLFAAAVHVTIPNAILSFASTVQKVLAGGWAELLCPAIRWELRKTRRPSHQWGECRDRFL